METKTTIPFGALAQIAQTGTQLSRDVVAGVPNSKALNPQEGIDRIITAMGNLRRNGYSIPDVMVDALVILAERQQKE